MIRLDKNKRILVMDLDGTVSDDRHRSHLAISARKERSQKLWDEYHSKCSYDNVHDDAASILKMMYFNQDHIIFSTGRNEKWRNHTVHWINEHLQLHLLSYTLLMRPDENYELASNLKPRQVISYINANYVNGFAKVHRSLTVCDDSVKVIDAWNEQNVTTIHFNRFEGTQK